MRTPLAIFALAGNLAFAQPACRATVTLSSDQSTKTSVTLKADDLKADPILLQAVVNGISFATWFHRRTRAFDISITGNGIQGVFETGVVALPTGLVIDLDESPAFEAVLECKG